MRKCERCKHMFCQDCMVPDVSTGDYNAMLCLNCARRVVSPTPKSKYSGLANHLKFRAAFTDTVKLTFARIDGLIGSNLPMEAYREVAWWSNTARNTHTKAWLDVGWEVQEVNPKEGMVVFKKVKDVPFKKVKRAKKEKDKPFTPVPARLPKRKVPSKTKVSKLYARIKNLERQKAMAHGQIRGLKSSVYQKKLYKQNQKPKNN
ncbi:MAG: hypothetical protein NWF01_02065 [Candidatus Bathyarchaeota archaeon]|nr:hypothetical protein [Candidatus Bathyarchaeota archaeon]